MEPTGIYIYIIHCKVRLCTHRPMSYNTIPQFTYTYCTNSFSLFILMCTASLRESFMRCVRSPEGHKTHWTLECVMYHQTSNFSNFGSLIPSHWKSLNRSVQLIMHLVWKNQRRPLKLFLCLQSNLTRCFLLLLHKQFGNIQ